MPDLKGLPEGLEVDRFGIAGENDFELIGDKIRKGVRPNAAGGVLVKPKDGYTLQPQRIFDIREFKYMDGEPGVYTVVKQLQEAVPMKLSTSFSFTNAYDRDLVTSLLERIKDLPGCNGVVIE